MYKIIVYNQFVNPFKSFVKQHPYISLGGCVFLLYDVIQVLIYLFGYTSVFYGDMTLEVIQMAQHTYDFVRSSSHPLWDEALGFGAPISVQFWSFLTSPSFWIYVVLPQKTWFVYILPVINALRCSVLCMLGYKYLSYFLNKDQWMLYGGAILFASFGYTVYFTHYPYFADFMIFTLLLMIGCEQIIQHDKGHLCFILIVALTSITNLYNIYMNCWFLVVYLSFRSTTIDGMTYKRFWQYFIRFFVMICLGIGISAIVFIPNIASLLSNNRVGVHELSLIKSFKDVYGLITAFISPILNDFDYNLYLSYTANSDIAPLPYIYTSILLVLSICSKTKYKWKKPLMVTLVILCLLSLTPLSNVIFCGDAESNRWVYFISVFSILFITFTIQSLLDQKDKLKGCWITIGLLIVFALVSYGCDLYEAGYQWNLIINTVLLTLLVLGYRYGVDHRISWILFSCLLIEFSYSNLMRFVNGAGFMSESKISLNQLMYTINEDTDIQSLQSMVEPTDFYRLM